MRRFFSTYWKIILVLIVLAALAAITINTSSADPDLPARLRAHANALASSAHTASYIETELAGQGYLVQCRHDTVDGQYLRYLEVSRTNLQSNQNPARMVIVGASDSGSGAAAALELARLLRGLRPSAGAELKFLFFARHPEPGKAAADSFIAFVGAPQSAALARQTLSAFHARPGFPEQGLAARAYVEGVTLFRPSLHDRSGYPALLFADTAFLGYPYRAAMDDGPDFENMARTVTGLSRAIPPLVTAQVM